MTPQNGRMGPRQNLVLALHAAREDFPPRGAPATTNVCLCHRTRMRVIKIAQAQRLRRDRPSAYIVLRGDPPLGQPVNIYAGVPLIACVNATKDGIHNSMLLEVLSYTGDTITVKDREGLASIP